MIKKAILLSAAALLLTVAGASAQMLLISEVYGGGGNSGSTYSNDFIELYNYGTTPIDLSTLALYYTSATGTTYTASAAFQTILTGTLAGGAYYLVAEAQGAGGTTPLTGVNLAGSIALSGTSGKVVLGLANTVPSGTAGAVTAANNPSVIDIVGYGPTATQYRGAGPTAVLTNTTSDSKTIVTTAPVSNSTDFTQGAPSPLGTGNLTVGVPEPSSYAYVALGGLGALAMLRFRRHRTA